MTVGLTVSQKLRFGVMGGQSTSKSAKLTWNFFWAHRGHNTCDSHAGVLKRAVREEERNSLVTMNSPIPVWEWSCVE